MAIRALSALLVVAVAAYALSRPRQRPGYGSNTNASDAVDAPFIGPDATGEDVLDVGVQYTFPASDPVSIDCAYRKRA
jgi:hypothetical protein